MVTAKDRLQNVKRSIQCYVDQTYLNKELIIVNEGPPSYQKDIEDYASLLNRPDIKFFWLNGKYTLGSLRNISILLADGEYFCQWDDDDFCIPTRLSTQISYLLNQKDAIACYLGDQLHYYFHTKELYWDNWAKYCSGWTLLYSIIPGTLMARCDVDVKYPTTGKFCSAGEDSVFSTELIKKHESKIALLRDCGYMHIYSYHNKNQVYDLDHHMHISTVRSNKYEDLEPFYQQICNTLDYMNFGDNIKVMAREGLFFEYRSKK